jgi:hypothetical protein
MILHERPQTTRPNGLHGKQPVGTSVYMANDPLERVYMGSDTRPKRSHKGDSGKWAAQSCTKPTHGHNLAFYLWPRVPWAPSHDMTRHDPTLPVCTGTHTRHVPTRPNEIWGFHGRTTRTKFRGFRVRTTRTKFRGFRGRTTRTKPRGSIRQTGHTNMQRTHERSRLSIFGTPTCARAPHTARHGPTGLVRADPTRPNAFARAPTHDTTRPDPNKIWGFLICTTRTKFGVSMGARPERRHKAASGKRAARTCRRHTGGHDLAFLALPTCARAPTHGRTRPARTKARRSVRQTGRANVQEAHGWSRPIIFCAATCSRAPTRGTARPDPTRLARTRLHGHPHTTRPDPPERNLGFPCVHAANEIWGFHGCTTRTKARGSVGQTGRTNVQKAHGR